MTNQRLLRTTRRQRGQALLLAIVVMLMLALLAAALVAVIAGSTEESSRDEYRVKAKTLAQAGLRYADEMLTESAQGADWRPRLPAYLDPNNAAWDPTTPQQYWDSFERLRGWNAAAVRQHYADPTQAVYYIKFRFSMDEAAVAAGTSADPTQDFMTDQNGTLHLDWPIENAELTAPHDHFLLRVEYQPDPNDPLSKYLKITSIGRPGGDLTAFQELVGYKAVGLMDYGLFIHDRQHEGGLTTIGIPGLDLDGDGSTASANRAGWDGSAGGNATGSNDYIPLWVEGPLRANTDLQLLAPARLEPVQSSTGWKDKIEVAGALSVAADPSLAPLENSDPTVVGNGDLQVLMEQSDTSVAAFSNRGTGSYSSTAATAPSGNLWPDTLDVGVSRLEAPALESYEPLTGVSRWDRMTRYSGVDVNLQEGGSTVVVNSGELGYGRGIYVNNALQRDNLSEVKNTWLHPETWGGRRYLPNGCIIELIAHYPDPLATTDPPVIAITRTDGSTWVDPVTGRASGRPTMLFAFPRKDGNFGLPVLPTASDAGTLPIPENGLIVCEGNVRVLGRLPYDSTGTYDYNLTVVSRGSVYVDGPLLRPSDYTDAISATDGRNTRIALLARDHVVLNPTALAPGPVQGLPPGPWQGANAADGHWLLDPTGTQAIGLRVAIAKGADGGVMDGRFISLEHADATSGDGLPARTALLLARTRAGLGRTPRIDYSSTTEPLLLNLESATAGAQRAQIPGLSGGPNSSGFGFRLAIPVFLADWANLNQPIYTLVNTNLGEYWPDTWHAAYQNFNRDPATEDAGVPSFIYAQGGIDLLSGQPGESRSDVALKNMKIERFYYDGSFDEAQPRVGLDMVVSALMYAERGSFFVIPGNWYDPRAETLSDVLDSDLGVTAVRLARLKRYNYRVTVNGAIAVNSWATPMEMADWTDKWSYPPNQVRQSDGTLSDSALGGTTIFNEYGSVRYRYDWGLRSNAAGRPNLVHLPALPASPGLVYVGEENKQ